VAIANAPLRPRIPVQLPRLARPSTAPAETMARRLFPTLAVSPHLARLRASFSGPHRQRILDACPHATQMRNFHGWLKASRVVRKGQKGIRIEPPVLTDGSKVTTIRHTHVFDISQTDERTQRTAAAKRL